MQNKEYFDKVDINFHVIDKVDPKWFAIQDYSNWGGISEKPAIVEVTVAGFEEPVVLHYIKCEMNQFNALSLGLTCGKCTDMPDLPDGIYTITVKGSPDKYQKTKEYIRTVKLEQELSKLLLKNVKSCGTLNKEALNKIREIDFLVRAAKANIHYGNSCEAFELFDKATKRLDKLSKCPKMGGNHCEKV